MYCVTFVMSWHKYKSGRGCFIYDLLCCHASGGLGAKVVRNDSLAKFLSQGRQRREQEDRNILPQRTEAERKEFRQAIGTQLNR